MHTGSVKPVTQHPQKSAAPKRAPSLNFHSIFYRILVHVQGRKTMQMLVASERGEVRPEGQPAQLKPATMLPTPNSGSVALTVSGGELVAVLQFDGYITPKSAEAARQKLMGYLKRGGCGAAQLHMRSVDALRTCKCRCIVVHTYAANAVRSSTECVGGSHV